ncbi:hypothetical protein ACJ7K1_19145 [Paenibacillus elgii]
MKKIASMALLGALSVVSIASGANAEQVKSSVTQLKPVENQSVIGLRAPDFELEVGDAKRLGKFRYDTVSYDRIAVGSVRVFKDSDGYVWIQATYSTDGKVGNVQFKRNGEVVREYDVLVN